MLPLSLNEFGLLTRVAVKHARDAFRDEATLAAEWRSHGFTAEPDLSLAVSQYDRFLDLLTSLGAEPIFLPADSGTTIDSIYVRDATIVTPHGLVLCNMGKRLRAGEPAAQGRAFEHWRPAPEISGHIEEPGRLEGGDVIWLDARTLAVGRGYRTNAEGVRQLRAILGPSVEVIEVPLPHWHGPGGVLHLMSLISPVDRNLAVVYSPLLPVPFLERLSDLGIALVDTPAAEFDSMGTNVLALAPRRCVMLAGNPQTRAALKHAGAHVVEYDGSEISVKGAGGPTCLTRPLARAN